SKRTHFMRRKLKTDAAKKSFRQRQPVLGRGQGGCRSWRGLREAHLLLRRVHGARRRRRLSYRSPGRARLAAGEPADLSGALLCLPVDRLAAGGEGDRAESQQTSRKVIFVIFLAENASRFAAVHSKRPFHRFAPVNSLSHG